MITPEDESRIAALTNDLALLMVLPEFEYRLTQDLLTAARKLREYEENQRAFRRSLCPGGIVIENVGYYMERDRRIREMEERLRELEAEHPELINRETQASPGAPTRQG